ncbi:MAG: heavy metal-responsive transcriptional regulator [Thermodesulfobacteriota bacterium]
MKKNLTIGRLAATAGVNVQTVRYYERRGLLMPAGRKASGYRLYGADSVRRIKFIRRAKELGFTLDEIKGLLDLRVESPSSCAKVKKKASEKLEVVEERIKALKSVKRVLKGLVDSCEKRRSTEECPILKTIEKE